MQAPNSSYLEDTKPSNSEVDFKYIAPKIDGHCPGYFPECNGRKYLVKSHSPYGKYNFHSRHSKQLMQLIVLAKILSVEDFKKEHILSNQGQFFIVDCGSRFDQLSNIFRPVGKNKDNLMLNQGKIKLHFKADRTSKAIAIAEDVIEKFVCLPDSFFNDLANQVSGLMEETYHKEIFNKIRFIQIAYCDSLPENKHEEVIRKTSPQATKAA